MNITKFIIAETIIFIAIAFVLHKFFASITNEPVFKIMNLFLWISIIILSILINTRKFLFFISTFLILIILCIIFIIKYNIKKYFKDKLYYGVYMLIGITFFGLFNFIVTKYFIYNIVNTEAPIGDNGPIGPTGQSGTNYYTNTFAERCYVDLITNLENEYKDIKKTNKINVDDAEYGIKNYYFKNNIKRICYSTDFLDKFYLNSDTEQDKIPECIMNYDNNDKPTMRKCNIDNQPTCKTDIDCLDNVTDTNTKYNNEITNLKQITTKWMKEILKNNCYENINLRNEHGGQIDDTLDDIGIDDNSHLKYNSKIGRQFLNDYFQNDIYLDETLNKNVKENPFNIIKKDNEWYWGLSTKNPYNSENIGKIEQCYK